MKSIKNIISLVLILVMISSSLSAFAVELPYKVPYEYMEQKEYNYMDSVFKFDVGEFAEKVEEETPSEGETEGDAAEEAVSPEDKKNFDLLTAFGIWDDPTIKGEALVNKTEFSIIVARAKMGLNNAFEEVYKLNEDNSSVTYADVLKYFLEGLGYYYRCSQYNFSDEGLLIVARQIGLIGDGIEIGNIKSVVNRSTLAKIVLKAINIDICKMVGDIGGYSYEVIKGVNLLNSVHGIYDLSGYVNGVPNVSVFGAGRPRAGHMEIDRKDILIGDFAVVDYLGTQVKAYAKLDEASGLYTLIHIAKNEEYENLEISFNDISYISDSLLKYIDENGDEQEVDVIGINNIIQNTDKINSLTEIFDVTENDGKIILSSSGDEDAYDCAVIWKYDYLVVRSNSEANKKIYLEYNIKYNNNDYIEKIDNSIEEIYLDGKAVEWKKIPAGAIIRIARSADNSYTQIYAKSNASVAGLVTQEDGGVFTIDDTAKFRVTKNLQEYIDYCASIDDESILPVEKKIFEITVGTKGTFYTFDDYIVVYTQGSNYSYAYLKSATPSKSVVNPTCTVRIFTQKGEWLTCPIAQRVTLDGKENCSVEEVVNLMRANSSVVGDLIRYQLNAKDEIVAIDTIIDTSDEATDSTRIIIPTETPHVDDITINSWNKETLNIDKPYLLHMSTVVFIIPEKADNESAYVAGTNTALNGKVRLKFYSPSPVNIPAVVMSIPTEDGSSSGSAEPLDYTNLGNSTNNGEFSFVYVEKITRIVIDPEKGINGYKFTCSDFIWHQTRAAGNVRTKTFTMTDEEYESDPNPPVVGNFLMVRSKAKSLASRWVMLEDGVVPVASDTVYDHDLLQGGWSGSKFVGSGVIEAIDYINEYVKVRSYTERGEKVQTIIPDAKGIIDTTKKKATEVGLADFSVGDHIYFYNNYSNGAFVFKNQD